jgi:aldose 1-epimerase
MLDLGALQDGSKVEAVELANGHGVAIRLMTLGASIQSLAVPNRNGHSADIVLGHATAAEYLAKPQYFGGTVGRFANRIADGAFELDGKRYQLEQNDGPNHLHGGHRGFDRQLWKIASASGGKSALFSLSSPDGDAGYPGTLDATVSYTLNDRNELTIEYRATTDRPTIVNLSGHSYFNLAGEASGADVYDHRLTLEANFFTPVSAKLIPTGERRPVENTPFDFRKGQAIGSRIRDGRDEQLLFGRGYDHNFMVNGAAGTLRRAARVADPKSGRVLEVLTAAPAIQFYSGNFLDGTTVGKSGQVYRQGDAFCLEPQTFPDAPNHADFPSARLDPGQVYRNIIVYRFLLDKFFDHDAPAT